MAKRWIFRPLPSKSDIQAISMAIGIHPIIASLLLQRTITSFDEAKIFFRPCLSNLNDPFLMKDMEKAVDRLQLAIQKGERILIYGDYDVDGVTSVAMCYDFLQKIYDNVVYYIPDRYQEGYGVSKKGIQWAAEKNVKLIITLDCGIRAINTIQQAYAWNIDVIVTDHHEPGGILPPAYAILNPKQKDCCYPFKELSGCGIGFKLLQGFCQKDSRQLDLLYTYLDLVCLSIAADIVPINGENRILATYGLKKITKNPSIGIQALLKIIRINTSITISDIVFQLAPRINAAGRMAHAKEAVELLLEENKDKAIFLAKELNKKNVLRQKTDSATTAEAIKMIKNCNILTKATATVLFNEHWHKGVVGIVASRCIEYYYRPTVILTAEKDKATGSARSVIGFNIYQAIEACADLLDQFGGHIYAAGLTMPIEHVALFQKKFEEVVRETIKQDTLIPLQTIDLEISLKDLTHNIYKIIAQMMPFGPQNMQPVFATHEVVADEYTIIKDKHLKMFIYVKNGGYLLEGIGFGLGHYASIIQHRKPFSMAYNIEKNAYLGKNTIQLIIKDIKPVPKFCK